MTIPTPLHEERLGVLRFGSALLPANQREAALSIIAQYDAKGHLTEKQWDYVLGLGMKVAHANIEVNFADGDASVATAMKVLDEADKIAENNIVNAKLKKLVAEAAAKSETPAPAPAPPKSGNPFLPKTWKGWKGKIVASDSDKLPIGTTVVVSESDGGFKMVSAPKGGPWSASGGGKSAKSGPLHSVSGAPGVLSVNLTGGGGGGGPGGKNKSVDLDLSQLEASSVSDLMEIGIEKLGTFDFKDDETGVAILGDVYHKYDDGVGSTNKRFFVRLQAGGWGYAIDLHPDFISKCWYLKADDQIKKLPWTLCNQSGAKGLSAASWLKILMEFDDLCLAKAPDAYTQWKTSPPNANPKPATPSVETIVSIVNAIVHHLPGISIWSHLIASKWVADGTENAAKMTAIEKAKSAYLNKTSVVSAGTMWGFLQAVHSWHEARKANGYVAVTGLDEKLADALGWAVGAPGVVVKKPLLKADDGAEKKFAEPVSYPSSILGKPDVDPATLLNAPAPYDKDYQTFVNFDGKPMFTDPAKPPPPAKGWVYDYDLTLGHWITMPEKKKALFKAKKADAQSTASDVLGGFIPKAALKHALTSIQSLKVDVETTKVPGEYVKLGNITFKLPKVTKIAGISLLVHDLVEGYKNATEGVSDEKLLTWWAVAEESPAIAKLNSKCIQTVFAAAKKNLTVPAQTHLDFLHLLTGWALWAMDQGYPVGLLPTLLGQNAVFHFGNTAFVQEAPKPEGNAIPKVWEPYMHGATLHVDMDGLGGSLLITRSSGKGINVKGVSLLVNKHGGTQPYSWYVFDPPGVDKEAFLASLSYLIDLALTGEAFKGPKPNAWGAETKLRHMLKKAADEISAQGLYNISKMGLLPDNVVNEAFELVEQGKPVPAYVHWSMCLVFHRWAYDNMPKSGPLYNNPEGFVDALHEAFALHLVPEECPHVKIHYAVDDSEPGKVPKSLTAGWTATETTMTLEKIELDPDVLWAMVHAMEAVFQHHAVEIPWDTFIEAAENFDKVHGKSGLDPFTHGHAVEIQKAGKGNGAWDLNTTLFKSLLEVYRFWLVVVSVGTDFSKELAALVHEGFKLLEAPFEPLPAPLTDPKAYAHAKSFQMSPGKAAQLLSKIEKIDKKTLGQVTEAEVEEAKKILKEWKTNPPAFQLASDPPKKGKFKIKGKSPMATSTATTTPTPINIDD